MKLDRARRVFASHMAAARSRKLTAYEKLELTKARQALRQARRPAGLSKVNPKRKRKAIKRRKAVHSSKPFAVNPGKLIRMGKLVEIRYYRDHGRAPGYYKHPFKVRPTIYYRPSDNSIFIKSGRGDK